MGVVHQPTRGFLSSGWAVSGIAAAIVDVGWVLKVEPVARTTATKVLRRRTWMTVKYVRRSEWRPNRAQLRNFAPASGQIGRRVVTARRPLGSATTVYRRLEVEGDTRGSNHLSAPMPRMESRCRPEFGGKI